MKPYYQDDWCTIFHGDCREILPQLEPVDLVLTDPPYIFESSGGGGIAGKRQYAKEINTDNFRLGFDMGILKKFKNWFCFCSREQLAELITVASENKKNWMILTWCKPNPTPFINNSYLPDTEYIIHSFGKNCLFGGYEDKHRYIIYPVEKNDFEHPTVKPVSIIQKLVRLGSQENEIILDPFMGSGTTLRAAKDLKRKSIGIEIEEKYCEIAVKRLRQEVLL